MACGLHPAHGALSSLPKTDRLALHTGPGMHTHTVPALGSAVHVVPTLGPVLCVEHSGQAKMGTMCNLDARPAGVGAMCGVFPGTCTACNICSGWSGTHAACGTVLDRREDMSVLDLALGMGQEAGESMGSASPVDHPGTIYPAHGAR